MIDSGERLRSPGYLRNMPSLRKFAKMSDSRVYKSLSVIPSSDYYGVSALEISQNVCHHDAVRHLNDLILINNKNKSENLYLVSEKSNESCSV